MKHRLFMAFWFACALIASGMFAYLKWLEPPVVSYPELPFQVLTPVVRAGESVRFVVERTMHTRKPVDIDITRWLVNAEKGGHDDLLGSSLTIKWDDPPKIGHPTMPHSTLSGFYRVCGSTHMRATLPGTYRDVPWCSQTFQVIGAPDVMAPTAAEGIAGEAKQRAAEANPSGQQRNAGSQ